MLAIISTSTPNQSMINMDESLYLSLCGRITDDVRWLEEKLSLSINLNV